VRNFFDWRIDLSSNSDISDSMLWEEETGDMDEENVQTLEIKSIFRAIYSKEYDSVDNNTHLVKMFELVPGMLGYKTEKKKKTQEKLRIKKLHASGTSI